MLNVVIERVNDARPPSNGKGRMFGQRRQHALEPFATARQCAGNRRVVTVDSQAHVAGQQSDGGFDGHRINRADWNTGGLGVFPQQGTLEMTCFLFPIISYNICLR